MAYSFKSKDVDDITLKGKCILFENCDKNVYKEGWLSGFKSTKQLNDYNVYPGIECKESDVGSDSNSNSFEECGEDCDSHSECIAFSFRASDGKCEFYNECDEREEDSAFMTGVNKYHGRKTCPFSILSLTLWMHQRFTVVAQCLALQQHLWLPGVLVIICRAHHSGKWTQP